MSKKAEPLVPLSLLSYLRDTFPRPGYRKGETLADVAQVQGMNDVIDHLQSLHDDQQARASRSRSSREGFEITQPFTET